MIAEKQAANARIELISPTFKSYFLVLSETMEGVCSAHIQAQRNKHSRKAKGREGEMNKRKLGSFALCAILFALCLPAQAQQPGKIPWIGYLAA